VAIADAGIPKETAAITKTIERLNNAGNFEKNIFLFFL
jgi:hypothetical protein